jgi:hypothetical protein
MQFQRSEQRTGNSVNDCSRRNCVAEMVAGLEFFGEYPYVHCRARVALSPAELYAPAAEPNPSSSASTAPGAIASVERRVA